jgi:acetyl-CoA synthetase
MTATESYRAARDTLLELRGDHAQAVREFRRPDTGERFNWAVDWFDAIARGDDRPALGIAEDDGTVTTRTFDELAVASDRLAAWLAGHGVGRGDPVV